MNIVAMPFGRNQQKTFEVTTRRNGSQQLDAIITPPVPTHVRIQLPKI